MSGIDGKTQRELKPADDASPEVLPTGDRFTAEMGPWRTVGVCVASPAHVSAGKGCEDEIKFLERNGILACALADGAGSRKKCKIGARIAVAEACEELVEHFDDLKVRAVADALIHRINLRLARQAAELRAEMGDLASTLAFVAVRGSEFVAGNLGDGIVGCVQNSSGKVLIVPEWGKYANQTYFTTEPGAVEHTRIVSGSVEGDGSSFILMSDGPVKRLYDFKAKAFLPISVEIGSMLLKNNADDARNSLESFMKDRLVPRANDDCSIILVSRASSIDNEKSPPPGKPATLVSLQRPRAPPKGSKRALDKAKPKKKKNPGRKTSPRKRSFSRKTAEKRLHDRHPSSSLFRDGEAQRRKHVKETSWRRIFASWAARLWIAKSGR
jgi:hypothetical protein